MIVSFTGHRPDKIHGYESVILHEMIDKLEQLRPERIISGMARGVDTIAAHAAIYLGIPFTAAVPFMSHKTNHSDADSSIYNYLVDKAADIVIVCDGEYAVWKFQKRNEYMVNHSDHVLAVWDGSRGGTHNCVKYAVKASRPIEYLNPTTGLWEDKHTKWQ